MVTFFIFSNRLHKVIGKHLCTNTKYHKSLFVKYLKLTLQELIKNCKEKKHCKFPKGKHQTAWKKKEEKQSEKSTNTAPLHMGQSLLNGRAWQIYLHNKKVILVDQDVPCKI